MTRGDQRHRAPPGFTAALQLLPLPAVTLDERGVAETANAAFLEATGWDENAVVGSDFSSLFLDGDDVARFRDWVGGHPPEALPSRFECELVLRDGSRPRVRWAGARMTSDVGRPVVLIVGDDVSDDRGRARAPTNAERYDHVAHVEMLDAASQALALVGLDYSAAIDTVVRRAAELVGETCAIGLVPGGGGPLRVLAVHNADPVLRAAITGVLMTAPHAITGTAVERVLVAGVPVLLSTPKRSELSIDLVAEFQVELEQIPVSAILLVPMRLHGNVIGALGLCRHESPRPYSAEDQVFVQALADRAALTIHNAHLYAENQKQAEELRQANTWLEKRIEERTAELERVNEQLLQQAIEDGLTGLANRRHFNSVLSMELRRARRDGSFLSLLLADVDFFKKFNDTHGHLAGDQCLGAVADVLKRLFRRAADLAARYGGEEFAVILSGCDPENACRLAERCRQEIAQRKLVGNGPEAGSSVTVSIGVVSSRVSSETTAEWYVRNADRALYASKERGRNCVTVAGELIDAETVCAAWFGEAAASLGDLERKAVGWFQPSGETKTAISARFRDAIERAERGEFDGLRRSARGRLALALLLGPLARIAFGPGARQSRADRVDALLLDALDLESEGALSVEERLYVVLALRQTENGTARARARELAKRLEAEGGPDLALLIERLTDTEKRTARDRWKGF